MKKNIALLLGLVLGLGFVSCSSDDDDDDEYTNGEGKYLAEMIRTRYDWKDGKRSSEGKTYSIYRYDEKGQIVCSEFLYDRYSKYEHIYDDNGREIETNNYDSDKLSDKLRYEYNSFGKVSVKYRYVEDRLRETWEYEYDNTGRVIKETDTYHYVDGTSKTATIFTYGYGEKADTTYLYYPNNGGFYRKSIREYDSHHNTVKITNIYANGDTDILENIHEYDSKGRATKLVGPIFVEGVDPTRYAATQYIDISYNEDGDPHIMHYKIPSQNEEYDLEYTYKYKKK
jgi:hypothetical protein